MSSKSNSTVVIVTYIAPFILNPLVNEGLIYLKEEVVGHLFVGVLDESSN